MNKTQLTSARYDFIHRDHGLNSDTVDTILSMFEREIGYPAPTIEGVTEDSTPIGWLPDRTQETKVAICIGHARAKDSGAVSVSGISEEEWNNKLAVQVKQKLAIYGIKSEIISFYQGSNYGDAMRWLAQHLQKNDFTVAIELHFNSFESSSKGYEYLYWHTSTVSDKLAATFQNTHREFFPKEYDRGVEPLGDQAHERGVYFCKLTHCPAIICEPFFGSNPKESERYMTTDGTGKLSSVYASALNSFL